MKNKTFGYARVSSKEQNEERKIVAFKKMKNIWLTIINKLWILREQQIKTCYFIKKK